MSDDDNTRAWFYLVIYDDLNNAKREIAKYGKTVSEALEQGRLLVDGGQVECYERVVDVLIYSREKPMEPAEKVGGYRHYDPIETYLPYMSACLIIYYWDEFCRDMSAPNGVKMLRIGRIETCANHMWGAYARLGDRRSSNKVKSLSTGGKASKRPPKYPALQKAVARLVRKNADVEAGLLHVDAVDFRDPSLDGVRICWYDEQGESQSISLSTLPAYIDRAK